MKKISLIIAALLIITGTSFAITSDSIIMEFTGEEIMLSLEDAKAAMLSTGIAIETAELNLKMNKAKTKSYYENVTNINNLRKLASETWGVSMPSRTMVKIVNAAASFASEQSPRNYDAEINKIIRSTVENYYLMAQVKEGLRIGRENVEIQEKLYQNTLSKFNLGVASKQDVLRAEIGLNEARVAADKAQMNYSNVRMGFNITFGFDLMQDVTITDELEEAEISNTLLPVAIAMALQNRNEIYETAFGLTYAELSLEEVAIRNTRLSAAYLEAAAQLAIAESAVVNVPKQIEMEVRSKYMDMIQKKKEVELGKLNLENAKETYRLANLQYDAGMVTLTDTQLAQLGAYNAEINYFSALLALNLAVIDYDQSYTVGTYSARF